MLDSLALYLTEEHTAQVLRVLRLLVFSLIGLTFVMILFHRVRGPAKPRRHVWMIVLLLVVGFLGIFAYQANWQLIGFLNPKFVLFMERYNPRHENPAAKLSRGRILDCSGAVLAVSAPEERGFRRYPEGEATAHIVGYRHPLYGMMGIERAADAVICGYLLDVQSKEDLPLINRTVLQDQRTVGNDVMLSIDAALQRTALELFQEKGYRGAAVALDPRDGCIRLLATAPSFDPNVYTPSLNKDTSMPLLNRSIQGLYPPGSTFKLAIAALAYETGHAGIYDCPASGYFPPGARKAIHDHEWYDRGPSWPGFGRLDIKTAFAKSSNTYFAQAGVLSGTEAFNRLAEALCINRSISLYESPSGNRLATAKGSVPVLGTGTGAKRELSQLSIGQGKLLVTPLHVAMLGAAIANDGVLYKPHLDEMGEPEVLSTVLRRQTAYNVRQLMRAAVLSGTGRKADVEGIEVGGKTGTAQNPHGKSHGWFVCLAPASSNPAVLPKLVIAVVVENQGYGSQTAVPIATKLMEKAKELGYFEN